MSLWSQKCQVDAQLTLAGTSSVKTRAGQASGPLVPSTGVQAPAGEESPRLAHLVLGGSPGTILTWGKLAPVGKTVEAERTLGVEEVKKTFVEEKEGKIFAVEEVEGTAVTCEVAHCSCSEVPARSPRQRFFSRDELLREVLRAPWTLLGRLAPCGPSSPRSRSSTSLSPLLASPLMDCATMQAFNNW